MFRTTVTSWILVCTHIVDIDSNCDQAVTGNYSFWHQSSQLRTLSLGRQQKSRREKKELQNSSRVLAPTHRNRVRQPAAGNYWRKSISTRSSLLPANIRLSFSSRSALWAIRFARWKSFVPQNGEVLFKGLDFFVNKGDKIAILSKDSLAVTSLFKPLNDELKADGGKFTFGQTITTAYLPSNNEAFFNGKAIIWSTGCVSLRKKRIKMKCISAASSENAFLRRGGFQEVECAFGRWEGSLHDFTDDARTGELLMLDEPTNHLDLESITAFNNALKDFPGTVLFIIAWPWVHPNGCQPDCGDHSRTALSTNSWRTMSTSKSDK